MDKRIILILIVCFSGFSLQAQKAKKETIKQDIILGKESSPEVLPSEKILILPELENSSLEKIDPGFTLTESPAYVKAEYLPLPTPGIRTEFPSQQQRGYLRLGAGSKLSFVGDGQMNLLRTSKQTLDIRLMHKSIFGEMTNTMGVKDEAYMNKNRLMANYKLNLQGKELSASFSEKYNSWNYYGTWQTPTTVTLNYPTIDNNQWSSDSKFAVSLKSREPDQAFTWSAGIEGHLFRLGRGIQDSTLASAKGGFEKEMTFFGNINYDISEKFHLGIDGNLRKFSYREPITYPLDQYFNTDPASTVNYFASQSWLELNPYARMTIKKWLVTAGVRVNVPTIETERVKYNLMATASVPLNDKMIFKAKIDGSLHALSYREGFEMNPYLDPFIHLQPLNRPIDLKVGIEYRPSVSLRINPVIGYERTNNMPFFYNGLPFNDFINQAYGKIFSVKYMKSNKYSGGADVMFNYRNKVTLSAELRYNHYVNYSDEKAIDDSLASNGRKAWHSPGLEMRYRLEIFPVEMISIFADFQVSAIRYAATTTAFSSRMDDIHDLNLGLTWKVTKDVDVFLHLDNILDQRYELWNSYRSHGLSAMVGGSVHF